MTSTSTLASNIYEKTISIADSILRSDFWQAYLNAEKIMLQNQEVDQLINEIRKKQEARSKLGMRMTEHPKMDQLDQEIDTLLEKLEQYEEVIRFQELQAELGECLSGITRIIGWTVEGLDVRIQNPTAGDCCTLPAM